MRRVRESPMRFERRARRVECFATDHARSRDASATSASATTQRARGKRLLRAKSPRGAAKQNPGLREIAELRHRDAAQRERRRIVAQRNQFQRAQRVAGRERTSRGAKQRVQRNPAKLVTPTLFDAWL